MKEREKERERERERERKREKEKEKEKERKEKKEKEKERERSTIFRSMMVRRMFAEFVFPYLMKRLRNPSKFFKRSPLYQSKKGLSTHIFKILNTL
jgi:hypothetical protein